MIIIISDKQKNDDKIIVMIKNYSSQLRITMIINNYNDDYGNNDNN